MPEGKLKHPPPPVAQLPAFNAGLPVLKQINHYEAQHILTNDKMFGGMARGRYGCDAVRAKALLPNPLRTHSIEVFWGASIGVSKYELSVSSVASFEKYTTLVEEPNFFTEPT